MNDSTNRIELTLPVKPEFVGIARLTASGAANRAGFDIETIEDIKVAVAEVCNRIVGQAGDTAGNYKIFFDILPGRLAVAFQSQIKALKCIFDSEEAELGLSIINALMDKVEYCRDSSYILSMERNIEGNSYNG